MPYNPETVTTYEGGLKSDLFGRTVRLNVSAFYGKFSNMQLIVGQCDALSPAPGSPCQQTTNAGDSKLWGIEAELSAHPMEGLQLDASNSYLHFKYSSVNPATGIPLNNALPFLIKTKVSAGVQYEFPIAAGKLTPRIDVSCQSSFGALGGTPVDRYTLANARLSYRPDNSSWELAAAVQNLFDRFYYTNKFDGNTTGISKNNPASFSYYNLAQGYVGKPRTFDVSVKYSF